MIDETGVFGRVKIFNTEDLLDLVDTFVGQEDRAMLFIVNVIIGAESGGNLCKLIIGLWIIAGRSGDNEWGPGLVD